MHRTALAPRRPVLVLVLLATALAGCSARPTPPAPGLAADGVPESRPGRAIGYLADDAIPDSAALLPPPPAGDAAGLDQARMRAALALRDTPRFAQATVDAGLDFPQAAPLFACALGVEIDLEHTPATWRLLRRTLADAARSTRSAKDLYRRPRPFLANGAPTCTPGDEPQLAHSGSYPSGHTAIGTLWSLVLASAAPERSQALLARGRAFGESRVVCNVHWTSDVAEGQFMGMATFARLQSEPAYLADLEAARRELGAARAAGRGPARDCDAEAAALAWPAPAS